MRRASHFFIPVFFYLTTVFTLGMVLSVAAAPASPPGATVPKPIDPFQRALEKGQRAYADQNYTIAWQFYQDALASATDQDAVVEAICRLAACSIARKKANEGRKIILSVPQRLRRFLPRPSAEVPDGAKPLTARNQIRLTYWLGRCFSALKKPKDALNAYNNGLRQSPEPQMRAQLLLGIGDCLSALKQEEKAIKTFANAAAIPGIPAVLTEQAVLSQLRILMQQKKYVEAETKMATLLGQARGTFRAQLGIYHITAALELKKVSDAYSFFKENYEAQNQLLHDPEYYPVLRHLGQALDKIQAHDSALRVFSMLYAVADKESHRQELLLDMAESAAAMGKPEEAIKKLKKFIQLYPTDPRVPKTQLRIGNFWETLNKPQAAEKAYRTVQKNEKIDASLRFSAATALGRLYRTNEIFGPGRFDQAIRCFYAASKLPVDKEKQAQMLYTAAEIYFFDLKNYNDAAGFYGDCANQFPDSKLAEDCRFKEGIARQKGKRYELAAQAFDRFLHDFPKSAKAPQALFNRSLAQKITQDYPAALEGFTAFAKQNPKSPIAPQALIHAATAAYRLDRPSQSVKLLTQVIQSYPESSSLPYALYRRGYLQLAIGDYDPALKDCYEFLRRFGNSSDINRKQAADIHLWLGDYFANRGKFDTASSFFRKLYQDNPDSPNAPQALYETAKTAYRQALANHRDRDEGLKKAKELIATLTLKYPDAPARIRAQAYFLRGDISSIFGDFSHAAEWFAKSASLVPKSELYYAALGRQGECNYAMVAHAENPQKAYHDALKLFQQVIKGINVPQRFVEMARYRAAKIYEKLDDIERARDNYYQIFYAYQVDRANFKLTDWYYFSRAGFDLARLYRNEKEYSAAIKIYQRLAKSGIPTAADAKRRAQELQQDYQ